MIILKKKGTLFLSDPSDFLNVKTQVGRIKTVGEATFS